MLLVPPVLWGFGAEEGDEDGEGEEEDDEEEDAG